MEPRVLVSVFALAASLCMPSESRAQDWDPVKLATASKASIVTVRAYRLPRWWHAPAVDGAPKESPVQDLRSLRKEASQGSGFLIGESRVATALHVVDGADAATVTFADGTVVEVESVAADNVEADVVLISIPDSERGRPGLRLGVKSPPIGSRVLSLGAPLGLSESVSEGIISGLRGARESERIQFTAPISPGSSGGPLLGPDGSVIGIVVSYVIGGQNLNFASPVAATKEIHRFERPLPVATWSSETLRSCLTLGRRLVVEHEAIQKARLREPSTFLEMNQTKDLEAISRAESVLARATRIDPGSPDAWEFWARAHMHLYDPSNEASKSEHGPKVIQGLEMAVRLDPNRSEAWGLLWEFYGRTGRTDDQKRAWAKYEELEFPRLLELEKENAQLRKETSDR